MIQTQPNDATEQRTEFRVRLRIQDEPSIIANTVSVDIATVRVTEKTNVCIFNQYYDAHKVTSSFYV